MGDRELSRWVADRLHDVLGFSETATAQFVVALATRAAKSGKGPSALLAGLADVEVPVNATSRAFAAELMARCVLLRLEQAHPLGVGEGWGGGGGAGWRTSNDRITI